jgi:diguanylate cyclase (GGDEF)-like protein
LSTNALTNALAVELFSRTRVSLTAGFVGIGVMIAPHWPQTPWQQYLAWAGAMALIFAVRMALANYALGAMKDGRPAIRFVNVESVLCLLTGMGWGLSLYVFDSSRLDHAFYLRLLILSATMAFILSATALFMRTFFAAVLPLGFTVIAFMLSREYIELRTVLVVSTLFYIAMVSGLAITTNRRHRKAHADKLAVLELSAELTSTLERERTLREKLDRLSRTDELTGALNRRGILAILETEIARSRRTGAPLAVLTLDIDHFKRINDDHGHPAGDLVIQKIADMLQSEMRKSDMLGRFGGEEFLIILPALDKPGACLAAERLRQAVDASEIALDADTVRVTVSIGVAVLNETDTQKELLARSDKALYAAKSAGRNRVAAE